MFALRTSEYISTKHHNSEYKHKKKSKLWRKFNIKNLVHWQLFQNEYNYDYVSDTLITIYKPLKNDNVQTTMSSRDNI